MDKLVISLGGSVFTDNPLRIGFIQKLAATVTNLREKFQIGIVVGGGTLARSYISALRPEKVNDNVLDEIGIYATRMNALSFTSFLDNVNTKIPTTVNDAAEMISLYGCVVMGGTEPGHTTDTVAALLAERIGAGILINGTSVDGVYDSDPAKNRDAKKYSSLSYEDAINKSIVSSVGAGPSVFMDLTSLVIAKRSSIRIYVIRGDDINEYLNICSTGKTKGTIIG
ncbi:MAG: UMP kinase [Thermoplasmataceae archaeon]|jgi:uridylate kinase